MNNTNSEGSCLPLAEVSSGEPRGGPELFSFSSQMSGWIKLHRQLKDWEWYSNTNVFRVFMHCLLSANWKTGRFQGIEIKRGSFFTSPDVIARETGLSRQQVRTALKCLNSTSEITSQSTSRGTLITVCKFETYNSEDCPINQPSNQPSNQRLTSDQPAVNQQVTTIEEEKKNKKERRKEVISRDDLKAKPQSRDEFDQFFKSEGLYPRDSEYAWLHWEENGWTNGKAKIKDWKATVRKWKAGGYFPTQKQKYDNETKWSDIPQGPEWNREPPGNWRDVWFELESNPDEKFNMRGERYRPNWRDLNPEMRQAIHRKLEA